MARVQVHNCTTEKEAWALVSHHLNNDLLAIHFASEHREGESEDQRDQRHDRIGRHRMELVGAFYLLTRRMKTNGHHETANKIEQLLEMLATQDLADPEVREAIGRKHKELDVGKREFTAAQEQVRAERAAKEKLEAGELVKKPDPVQQGRWTVYHADLKTGELVVVGYDDDNGIHLNEEGSRLFAQG